MGTGCVDVSDACLGPKATYAAASAATTRIDAQLILAAKAKAAAIDSYLGDSDATVVKDGAGEKSFPTPVKPAVAPSSATGPTDRKKRVDNLYSIMGSVENRLGGGEGIEGIYGSVTQTGMQKILDCLKNNTRLDRRSVVVDIGAGLGRPLLHAMVDPGVESTIGIELDHVKVSKAKAFLSQVAGHMLQRGWDITPSGQSLPDMWNCKVEDVKQLDHATHAYSFWEGVPMSGKEAFGRLFHRSSRLRAVAVVQRAMPRGQKPEETMRQLGFGPLQLISNFAVKMSGSGRSFQAYVFSKPDPRAQQVLNALMPNSTSPDKGSEVATQVYCPGPLHMGSLDEDPGEVRSAGCAEDTAAEDASNVESDVVSMPDQHQRASRGGNSRRGAASKKGGAASEEPGPRSRPPASGTSGRAVGRTSERGMPSETVPLAPAHQSEAPITSTRPQPSREGSRSCVLPDSPPKRTRSSEAAELHVPEAGSQQVMQLTQEYDNSAKEVVERKASIGIRASSRLAAKAIETAAASEN